MTDASGQGGGAVAADESAIRNDGDAIRQDQNAVANALNAQGSGAIADRQTIEQAAAAVTSALDDLAAARSSR
jgi:hypothetical protein